MPSIELILDLISSLTHEERIELNMYLGELIAKETNNIPLELEEGVHAKFLEIESICKEVANILKKGCEEKVYQAAICYELQQRNILYTSEETMPILYKGVPLGGGLNQRLDICLRNFLPMILELKAINHIEAKSRWQALRYMRYKNLAYGAVINFSQSEKGSLEIDFVVTIEGKPYVYNTATRTGVLLVEYSINH